MVSKKQRRNRIIFGISLLAIVLLFTQLNFLAVGQPSMNQSMGSVEDDDGFSVNIYERDVSGVERFFESLGLLTIADVKDSYVQGEQIEAKEILELSRTCDNVKIDVSLTQGFQEIHSESIDIGYVGPMSLSTQYIIDGSITQQLQPSQFSGARPNLNTEVICDGETVEESSTSFDILSEGSEPVEESSCPLSGGCQLGYELQNADSENCFCERQWEPNNGICETGEDEQTAIPTNDCNTGDERCAEDQILVDGFCRSPDRVCESQGGTVDCDTEPVVPGVNVTDPTQNETDGGDDRSGFSLSDVNFGTWAIVFAVLLGLILIIVGLSTNEKEPIKIGRRRILR